MSYRRLTRRAGNLVFHNLFDRRFLLSIVGDKGDSYTKLCIAVGNVAKPNSPHNLTLLCIYKGNDNPEDLRKMLGSTALIFLRRRNDFMDYMTRRTKDVISTVNNSNEMVISENLNNLLNVDECKPVLSQQASKSLHSGEHPLRFSTVGNSLRSKFFDFVIDRHQLPALKCKLCQLVISNRSLPCFVHIKSCHMNQIRGPSSACPFNSAKSFILVQYLTANDVYDYGEGTPDLSRASPYEILNAVIVEGKKMPGEIVELESRQGGVRKAVFLGVFSTHSDAFREMCRLNRENNYDLTKKPSPRSSLLAPVEVEITAGFQKNSASEIPPRLSPPTPNFSGSGNLSSAMSFFDPINRRKDDLDGNVTALTERMDTLQAEMTQIKELLVELLQNQRKMIQSHRIEEPLEFTYCSEKVVNQLMTQNDSPEAVAIALANKIFTGRDRHRPLDNRDPDRVTWLRRVLDYKYIVERQNKCARDLLSLWNVCQTAINKNVLPDIVSGNGSKRSATEPLTLADTLTPKTFRAMPKLTAADSSFLSNNEASTSKQSINNVSPLKIHYVPATLSRHHHHRSTTVFRPLSAGEMGAAASSLLSKQPPPSVNNQRARICRAAMEKDNDHCQSRETGDAGESPPILNEMPRLSTMGVDDDEDEEENHDKINKHEDNDGDIAAARDINAFSVKTISVTVKMEPTIRDEINGKEVGASDDASKKANDETDAEKKEDSKGAIERSGYNQLGSVVKIEEEFLDDLVPLEKNDDGVWTSDTTGQKPTDYDAEKDDEDIDEPPPQIDVYENSHHNYQAERSPKTLRAVL